MSSPVLFLDAVNVFAHWQGHRRLTRRVIEAFPGDELFTFRIGSMRPFGEMAQELLRMSEPIARGGATGRWDGMAWDTSEGSGPPSTRPAILGAWDASTRAIDKWWTQIPPGRFQEHDTAFGTYEGPVWSHVLYAVDNEIHHRGQGYAYLRALEVEPPHFRER